MARRVVAKIEHHAGELFPRLGFIVTNTQLANRKVVHFYNQRGKAEQWIKEGKQAVKMTRLSCHRFRGNEVRLWLSILAYNLGNLWRRLVLPKGNRKVVAYQPSAEAGEDGRTAGEARPVLLAATGRRAPDARAVRCDDATDRTVADSGKLTMIARPNQIAEEKGGGKSVREIDKEGSQLRGRVQGGTESRCFSTAIAALVLQYPSGAVQFKRIGAEKGDS